MNIYNLIGCCINADFTCERIDSFNQLANHAAYLVDQNLICKEAKLGQLTASYRPGIQESCLQARDPHKNLQCIEFNLFIMQLVSEIICTLIAACDTYYGKQGALKIFK